MNGVHDLGGMHGFGAVPVEIDGPFHEGWERTVFAMNVLLRLNEVYNLDEMRHSRERLDPAFLLPASYFEKWLGSIEQLLVEKEVLTEAEIEERVGEILAGEKAVPEQADPALATKAREAFETDHYAGRAWVDPKFERGDEVVVKNRHPVSHTRVPWYVRRASGVIDQVYGTFPVADAIAHGNDEAEPLYSVRFDGAELWGQDHSDVETLHIDMWERYLEPSASGST